MRSFSAILLIFSFAILSAGCGGSSNSTNPVDLVESGSRSLRIDAVVDGNEAGAGFFTTEFRVTLTDSLSAPVTNATVTVSHSVLGTVNLIWDTLTTSTFKAAVNQYQPGTYTLDVVRGTDFLLNGRVVGPDIHNITFPTLTDTIPLNTAFTTLWTRTSIAELVEVRTRDYGPVLSTDVGDTDDGSFLIPASATARDDQYVRLIRSNDVVLTMGRTGSSFTAKIRRDVDPFVVN